MQLQIEPMDSNNAKMFIIKFLGIMFLLYVLLYVVTTELPWIDYLRAGDDVVIVEAQVENIYMKHSTKSGCSLTIVHYTVGQKEYTEEIPSDIRDLSQNTIKVAVKKSDPESVLRDCFVIPVLWEFNAVMAIFSTICLIVSFIIYKKIKEDFKDYKIPV